MRAARSEACFASNSSFADMLSSLHKSTNPLMLEDAWLHTVKKHSHQPAMLLLSADFMH